MKNVNEQFVEIAKTNVETMVDLGNASFGGVEKFVELQLKVAKGAMGQSADNLKALVSVKDIQDFVKVQASFALPTMESAVGYANAVYGIISETANTYAKMAEAQISAGNEKITTAVEEFSKSAPAGSESGVALVKSALTAANAANGNQYYVVGYKGSSPYDAGLFYCPYVPLQMVRAVGENTFQPKIGFKTRYGLVANPFAEGLSQGQGALNSNANRYYRRVAVKNLM